MRPHARTLVAAALVLLAGCPRSSPKREPDLSRPDVRPAGPPLGIHEVSFAGPAGHRPDATFARGETVTCLFTVTDFTYEGGKADIRADVKVRGPGGTVLHQRDLVLLEGEAPTKTPGSIRSAASLTLSPAAPPGKHTVELAVRDRLGHRAGKGGAEFTLLGSPPRPVGSLTLDGLREAADLEVPPGAALPLALEVRGFKTEKQDDGHRVDLSVTASVEDSSGQRLSTRRDPLVGTVLPFAPASFPVEYITLLPADLTPGPHRLAMEVRDGVGGGKARALFRFKVVPRKFGVYNLHLHDAGNLPRDTFLIGEQLYVRLAVIGLKQSPAGEVDAAVDLAVSGPGGVYLARKAAVAIAGADSRAVARAGRYPVQLPVALPALCPTGKYRVVIRARDRLAGRETVREHVFRVQGKAVQPMSELRIDQLRTQERPDLPPSKGDTFVAGRSYSLVLRVGGAKLARAGRARHRVKVKADLRLKSLTGEVLSEQKGLFSYEQTLTYKPLRLVLPAEWKVPADLPGGLYDLEVVALDGLDERVSQIVRRVEILGARKGVSP